MNRLIRLQIFLGSLALLVAGPLRGADDRKLVDLILDAVKQNQSLLTSGSFRAVVDEKYLPLNMQSHLDVTVTWKGNLTRIEGLLHSEWVRDPLDPDIKRKIDGWRPLSQDDKRTIDSNIILLRTPQATAIYYERENQIEFSRSATSAVAFDSLLRLRPDESWFSVKRYSFTPQLERMPNWKGFSVKQENQRVEVYAEPSDSSRLTFDLAQGGNLISYEHWPPAQPRPGQGLNRDSATFEWKQTESGEWYPPRYHLETSYPDRSPRIVYTYDLTIEDFRPAPNLPPGLFDLDKLPIPEDAQCVEYLSSDNTLIAKQFPWKNRRTREREKSPNVRDSLNRLSDVLRSEGFGSRDRVSIDDK